MSVILLNVCQRTDLKPVLNAGECIHYKSTPSRLVREGMIHTLPYDTGGCRFIVYTLSRGVEYLVTKLRFNITL